jgi:hypothetical protein
VVDAQDAARRRLERDIHDGAQQHLVALAVNLSLAGTLAAAAPTSGADDLLAAQEAGRRRRPWPRWSGCHRGIYPPLLEAHGPGPRSAGPSSTPGAGRRGRRGRGQVRPERRGGGVLLLPGGRAERHQARGAGDDPGDPAGRAGGLGFTVEDDGVGYDPAVTPPGAGLANMRDRVESLGGR